MVSFSKTIALMGLYGKSDLSIDQVLTNQASMIVLLLLFRYSWLGHFQKFVYVLVTNLRYCRAASQTTHFEYQVLEMWFIAFKNIFLLFIQFCFVIQNVFEYLGIKLKVIQSWKIKYHTSNLSYRKLARSLQAYLVLVISTERHLFMFGLNPSSDPSLVKYNFLR